MNARLEKLPIDIWENKIPVDYQIATALEQTSKHFGFFNKPNASNCSIKLALRLMYCVFHDKEDNAQKLITAHPGLIFTKVTLLTHKNTVETIDSLQYAIKLASLNFVNKFINNAISNSAFHQQLHTTDIPPMFDLGSYKKAVNKYHDAYIEFLKKGIHRAAINNEILNVGQQQKTLPLWMLKKLFAATDNIYNYAKSPDTCGNRAYHYKDEVNNPSIDISEYSQWSRLGRDITLVRGPYHNNCITNKGYYTTEAIVSSIVAHDFERIMQFQSNAKAKIDAILQMLPRLIETFNLKACLK